MTVSEFQTIDLEGFAELLSQKNYDHNKTKQVIKQLWEASSEQDYKESFNLRKDYATNHDLPHIIEKNRKVVDEFIDKSWKVSRALLTGLALALGLEPEYLNQAHTNIGKSETLFRLLHYPPLKSDMNTENTIRAGRAIRKSSTGLQVLDKNKDSKGNDIWHNVPSVPGTIVVNIADLFSLWTEGRLHSAIHRVIIPDGDIAKTHRYSIAHFINPDASCKIYPTKSPLPAPYPAFEKSPGVQKASFGITEFVYGDTGDTYFQRSTADTNY